MTVHGRTAAALVVTAMLLGSSGCARTKVAALESKVRALNEQVTALEAENGNLTASHNATVDELRRTEEELTRLNQERQQVHQRLVSSERQRQLIRDQFGDLVREGDVGPSRVTRKIEELAKVYPGVSFDPGTGMGKLETDILFPSGSAELSPKARRMLNELNSVFMSPDAEGLRVMVVGHADSRNVATRPVREKHPSNWHLSTDRAVAVCEFLRKIGFPGERMGMAAYAGHQPIAPNDSPQDRQRNRRVEIFLLGPETPVVGWTETIPTVYR